MKESKSTRQPDPNLSALGADEAIPLLVDLHGGRLYSLSLRLCGSQEDAEELVQEVFLTAYRKWEGFEGRAEATTWLYTIASRACGRKRRRRAGEPLEVASLSELAARREGTIPQIPAPGPDPHERCVAREVQEAVEEALLRVPPDFRMALVLKDIADLSLQEVAQILGLKPETAKTRVYRARLALRQQLARSLPQRPAAASEAPPICRDLLLAKLEAVDRGADFPVPAEVISERCDAFFQTLDLTREACRQIGEGEIPAGVRRRLEEALRRVPPGGAEAGADPRFPSRAGDPARA